MKSPRRIVLIGVLAVALLASYLAAYRLLPTRDASRARNAGVFVHYCQFRHDWQVSSFVPAGWAEACLIRVDPKPFLPHPSWASLPQVLILEGEQAKRVFPHNAFISAPGA